VDRELSVHGSRHHNHRQQAAGTIRPDDQPTVGIFAGVFERPAV